MAGTPAPNQELRQRKERILDYLCDNIGQARTADELAAATGMSEEDAKVAADALAYEHEVVKERTEGGQAVYRRRP